MATPNSGATVWTYQNSANQLWTPYDPTISSAIENVYCQHLTSSGTSATTLNLGNVSMFLTQFQVDVQSMTQTNMTTGKTRRIQRFTASQQHPLSVGAMWQFEGDRPGEWNMFDLESMELIESHFLKKNHPQFTRLLDLSTTHLRVPYVIDFANAIQIRQCTGKKRRIQRVPLNGGSYTTGSQASTINRVVPTASSNMGTSSGGYVTRLRKHRRQPYSTLFGSGKASNHPAIQPPRLGAQILSGSSSQFSLPNASLQPMNPTNFFQFGTIGQTTSTNEPLPSVKKVTIQKTKNSKAEAATEVLNQYLFSVTSDLDKEDCCICCEKLDQPSSYGDGGKEAYEVVGLNKCGHKFHKLCLLKMYEVSHKNGSLLCPSCKQIYGVKTGNCPPGYMVWDTMKHSLVGYEQFDTISVTYHIKPGIQGPEHPNPGMPFRLQGFPRKGFLPDCDEGRKVLKLLMTAFKRRLMFTVGRSQTTGCDDAVTWNEIHHKTELSGNHFGHGYPDSNYLNNVSTELADHGVTYPEF